MTTELAQNDPKFLPTQMGVTEHKLRKLRKDYDPSNLPNQVEKGNDAYIQVHNKVMEITKVRTNIERVRKDLKADALEWGRKVDGEAKRLTALVEDIEAPWKRLKQAADEKQAREEAEASQAEQERVEAIERKVIGLQNAAEGLLTASCDDISARLTKVKGVTVTEDDYEEFYDAAVHHQQKAIETLESALERRAEADRQNAELVEAQRKIDEQQAEIARMQQQQAKAQPLQKANPELVKDNPQQLKVEHPADLTQQAINGSEFDDWWFEIGRNVKPETPDEWAWESFRERLALMAWWASRGE